MNNTVFYVGSGLLSVLPDSEHISYIDQTIFYNSMRP